MSVSSIDNGGLDHRHLRVDALGGLLGDDDGARIALAARRTAVH
jgi:hypothetical protein